jgi:hypothetical protein
VKRAAHISECGQYRYSLTRSWGSAEPYVCWVMLNPSTADGDVDDPTLRKCIGFSRRWGFGSLRVVNAYALRATDPRHIRTHADPIGWANDVHVQSEAARADLVVVGWGQNISEEREWEMDSLLSEYRPFCLGITKAGHPRHPLYVPYTSVVRRWSFGERP